MEYILDSPAGKEGEPSCRAKKTKNLLGGGFGGGALRGVSRKSEPYAGTQSKDRLNRA